MTSVFLLLLFFFLFVFCGSSAVYLLLDITDGNWKEFIPVIDITSYIAYVSSVFSRFLSLFKLGFDCYNEFL